MWFKCATKIKRAKARKTVQGMAITFKAVVFQHHKKQDGTYNVKIRVTHKRVKRFLPTNIFITKEDLTRGFKIKSQNVLDKIKEIVENYLSITSTISPIAVRLRFKAF
jgi:hypothetical protein